MVTVVKPWGNLDLPLFGGFSTCPGSSPAYPPFYLTGPVSSGMNTTLIYGTNWRDWKGRIRRGENTTTDLTVDGVRLVGYRPSHFLWSATCKQCNGTPIITNKGGAWVYGNFDRVAGFPTSNPSSLDVTAAKNIAKERFLLNALDKQRRFQGGVFLGELHRSVRMIRSPAKALFSSIVRTTANLRKKGKLLPVHKRREFLGNSYLEAAYGWAPLVSDIQNGAEALAEYNLKRQANKVYVRGSSGVVKTVLNETDTYNGLTSPLHVLATRTRVVNTSRVEVKYYGKIVCDPVDSLLLHERFFGLDLSSFVPTAWELMPYSFLVDYFSNIGNVINAWSFQTSYLYWVSRTVTRAYRRHSWVRLDPAFNSAQVLACRGRSEVRSSGELILDRLRIERSSNVLAEMSTAPSIRFRLPGTSMKWLNMAALAKVKFSKPFF